MFWEGNYSLELFSKGFAKSLTGIEIPSNFWIFQGSEYATDYEYDSVPNIPVFIKWWKEVRAIHINFWNWTFFYLVTILYFTTCNFEHVINFPEFFFLELFVTLSHFRIYKYFSFRSTRKPYPKFCQISKMECVSKSFVAHMLRNDWKNE